jgi:hypothetical protein
MPFFAVPQWHGTDPRSGEVTAPQISAQTTWRKPQENQRVSRPAGNLLCFTPCSGDVEMFQMQGRRFGSNHHASYVATAVSHLNTMRGLRHVPIPFLARSKNVRYIVGFLRRCPRASRPPCSVLFLLSMTVTHAAPGLDTSSGAAAVEPGEDKRVHEAHPSLPRNVIR